jgi:hypothetical protein
MYHKKKNQKNLEQIFTLDKAMDDGLYLQTSKTNFLLKIPLFLKKKIRV